MAVNGIEIKVGQVWRTRGGRLATVREVDGVFKHSTGTYPVAGDLPHQLGPHYWTYGGSAWIGTLTNNDLVELIRDEQGFTIWRGGEQPAETKGKKLDCRLWGGRVLLGESADRLRWNQKELSGDIVAYKIVDEATEAYKIVDEATEADMPDPDALAAETLESLGWHWDGQTWVQEPKGEPELQIEMFEPTRALDVQVGGEHYKSLAIQPIEYIHANGIPFAEGSVIKYVTRWRTKNGIKDLEKARHFLDLLIELEEKSEGGAA